MLFADIQSAFHGAVRELTACPVTPEEADVICRGLPVSPEDLIALKQHLQKVPAMQAENADNWLCRITAELHDTTWMTLASDDGPPILTRRGTRPGSHITFGLLLRRILDFRHTLRPPDEDPPYPHLAWSGVRSFLTSAPEANPGAERPCACLGDIAWADDLAACFVSPSAQAVAARSGTEAGYLSDAFAQHGLKLSFGPSKTAVMCVIRWQGSREVRKRLFGGCVEGVTRSIPVLRENGPPDSVPLVRCYRHLGVLQNVEGSIKDELRQRIGHAWQAFRKARAKVFKCKWALRGVECCYRVW